MYGKFLFVFMIFFGAEVGAGFRAAELKITVMSSFYDGLQRFLSGREYEKMVVAEFFPLAEQGENTGVLHFLQYSQERLEQCFYMVQNRLAKAEEDDMEFLRERVFTPRNITEIESLMFKAGQRGYYGAFLDHYTDGDFCQNNSYGREGGVLLGESLALFCFVGANREKSVHRGYSPENIYDELNGIIGILQRVCAYKKAIVKARQRTDKRIGA
jgi:hypothetical protein